MNKYRKIKYHLPAHEFDMGGMKVKQPFPSPRMEQLDPFILLHHADTLIPTDRPVSQTGVGPHPHRGFSPVTFLFKGGIHHRDSRGNDSTVYAGGTQWMNAGMGIIHSERPADNIHEIGSRLELIQLWVNTPAIHKMDEPVYYPLTPEQTPFIKTPDQLGILHIIAGELMHNKGPVPTLTPINAYTLDFNKGASFYIPIPEGHQAFLYLLSGNCNLNEGDPAEELHAVVFENDGEGIAIKASTKMKALLMTGLPLNEKLVSHGPFVMNSDTEILEALRDYRMGKMGILVE